ncbi:MAG: hypothetical protein CBD08_002005 [Cellvibrionales bacterium TMED148]|nr:hypothetical protein [Porticoccaceae bacterium]RPG92684.1 MAG: hypothetical protein CBD08_002005 [Cellvibrionales bacterium TMED148]
MRFPIFGQRERDKKRRKLYKRWIGSPDGTKKRKINHVRLLLHLEETEKLEELAAKDSDYGAIISALVRKEREE